MTFTEKDTAAVNAIRFLSVDMIQKANSGHPGLPIDAAPMAYVLWEKLMNFNPEDPKWLNRDRFVLSAGHGSALLYSLLHLNHFGLTTDDLKQFRQLGSLTPGHPEVTETPGIDATTGPLGQGLGMAVGMAMAEKHLAAMVNRPGYNVFDHYTYALVGDGDLMEGISHEAINIAGDKRLNKLIVLYDSNDVSLDGPLSLSANDEVSARFKAAKWDYERVLDGNNLDDIYAAIKQAQQNDRPTLIEVKTIIGYGTPEAGTNKVHGSALGEENVAKMREFYGWSAAPFEISDDIYDTYSTAVDEKQRGYKNWQSMFADYQTKFPDVAKKYLDNKLDLASVSLDYDTYKTPTATRVVNADLMQQIAAENDNFWGGAADLSSSNKTSLKADEAFTPLTPKGRNIYFGVREFGMAAAVNGITLHGGTRVFGSTFFVFSDYLKAAVRLAAIQQIPSTFIFTHDSLAVGEDGPTHEPIEQLAALRSIPNVNVIRPADANETLGAWQTIAQTTDRPSVLVLTRQATPLLEGADADKVSKGAYVISPAKSQTPDGILIATGSEVALAIEAQQTLRDRSYDVSVVSMPSMDIFKQQSAEYQESVLPRDVQLRISIEMASSFGWGAFTGTRGANVSVDRFGASGKGPEVVAKYGFTTDTIIKTFEQLWKANDK
ncbi:MAG: transketolase [Furfurilactobacillus sp.]|jgi:transketolase|uniref:Transketolase n=2 Tax=Furfurilactobacillus TaxID=2767882 RepID=A0ABT6DB77_9LACO|nr:MULTISPECIES: transketolase [Furfurilactobacillus]QLE65400.1 Transketolase [Furfurilactobacillus rossiae]MCF6160899.1 transketolase [Furfurilactobacillus milii]MCF6163335.1 transketolase [Furfurilactobacillus milii]MCH4011919.1 transketolase [Furfurilactobacillus sp.]MCH4037811.1 transketolase [Furfurilactobacillus sp.]